MAVVLVVVGDGASHMATMIMIHDDIVAVVVVVL